MKKTNRFAALLLTLVMILTVIPMNAISSMAVSASDFTEPTFFVDSKYSAANSTVSVDLIIANNPGIAGATLTISFDQYLTLVSAENGEAFSKLLLTKPGSFSNPSTFLWDSESGEATDDGTILTLTFAVSSFAQADTNLNIYISCNSGDIYDENMETVNMQVVSGNVTVIDYIPGDVNGDNVINGKDVTLIRRHIVGGYNQTINAKAANVNEDGTINGKDVTAIRRYIVGGYNVELKPSKLICNHNMEAVAGKAATCTEMGNIPYWYCTECDNYFRDESGTTEISLDNTVIPAKGHTVVIDPAVAPTNDTEGLTEGSHCSECGAVIVPQQPVSMLNKEEHSITYDIANGDLYLASLDINNNNQNYYYTEDGYTLKNLSVPGYTFLGWYDLPAGNNAENIKKIPAGSADDYQLYAHWSKIEYTVQYRSDVFIDKQSDTYTVDTGLTLNTPRLSNYIFTGWADDDGNLYDSATIPVGTVGNITLQANWTSERNKTFTKPNLDAPLIVEEDNMILFTYEIGEIQNVPVYTVHDFGYIAGDGVTKTETKTYSTTVTDEAMQSYSNSVAKATTESSEWTLSNNWNRTTSLDEQDYTEKGFTKEQAETIAKSNTNTWNVSSGSSGSASITTLNQSQNGWSNNVKINGSKTNTNSHEHTHTDTKNNSFKINGELTYTPKSYNVSLGLGDGVSVGAGTSGGLGGSLGLGYSHDWGSTDTTKDSNSTTKSRGFEAGGTKTGANLNSTTTSANSSWNSSSSRGGSSTASQSQTISNSVSEKIAKTYHYGETMTEGGVNSESKGLQQTQTSSDEYGSSVKYVTAVGETQTSTWTTQSTKPGYHRWIKVNTAHVFAVVGYDMSTNSYFVYTYSIMDDVNPPQDFEDYSYISGNYNDNENGVIPFVVPYEVEEYVAERICYSDGLKVNQATGTITGYTGTDDYVIIPEYYNIGDGDVVKITGILSYAFKGNTSIKAVRLSDFVTEIPDNAFEGCSSLLGVNGGDITSIGEEAFKGCTSLENCLVDNQVVYLGNNAFEGCDRLLVNAANNSVVEAAVDSGVNKIHLYADGSMIENGENALNGVTLDIPDDVELFTFNGYGYTYPGFTLNSDASETVINKVNLNASEGIPLQTSSSKLTLNQVSITSNGWGLVMAADNTELVLQSTIEITTAADKSVLSKNIELSELKENVDGTLKVSGKVYVAGDYSGDDYLFYNGDEINRIPVTDFDNCLNPHIVLFDANGGSVLEESKELYFGQKYGTLPEPTRDYYEFVGWYTEAEGGERVTSDSIFDKIENVTLYAHWSLQSFVITFNANGGSVATSSIRASCNTPIGTLPVPTKDYYTFDGWYTEATGGSKVTESYVYATPNDFTLYAHWTVNQYTYNIVYKSTNGTTLGSTTITNTYGSSSTVSAPGKTGYNTPASQTVVWDSSAKTINFLYRPQSVSTSQLCYDGKWMSYMTSKAWIEVGERTSTSVKIRIKMTNTINAGKYYGYYQWCQVSYGSTTSSKGTISNTVFYTSSDTSKQRSSTAYSGWISVPVSATTTSISVNYKLWSRQTSSDDGYFNKTGSKTVSIPTY